MEPKFLYSHLYLHCIHCHWQCCNTHLPQILTFGFWKSWPLYRYTSSSFHVTMISTTRKEKLKAFKHFTLVSNRTLPFLISTSSSTKSDIFFGVWLISAGKWFCSKLENLGFFMTVPLNISKKRTERVSKEIWNWIKANNPNQSCSLYFKENLLKTKKQDPHPFVSLCTFSGPSKLSVWKIISLESPWGRMEGGGAQDKRDSQT